MEQVIPAVQVVAVTSQPTRSGKTKYTLKDGNGQEWLTFDGQLAMKAGAFQGQVASLTVKIEPARDPKYGTNYYLNDIGPAVAGANPTAGNVAQPMPVAQGPVPTAVTPDALAAAGVTGVKPPPRYTDEELWEFARRDGLIAAAQVFQGHGVDIDLEHFYGLAESFSKFVRLRSHEGFVPGVQVDSLKPRPEDVVAQVNANAETGATVQQGMGQVAADTNATPEPAAASAATATGGENPWD